MYWYLTVTHAYAKFNYLSLWVNNLNIEAFFFLLLYAATFQRHDKQVQHEVQVSESDCISFCGHVHVNVSKFPNGRSENKKNNQKLLRLCVFFCLYMNVTWVFVAFQPLMTRFCCLRCKKSDPTVLIKTNGTDHSPLIVFHWQMAPLTLEDCCRGSA